MWWKTEDEKPADEEIRLVAIMGCVGYVRDIAWYDTTGESWENLKGEAIRVFAWNDCLLPTIPDDYYT